MQKEIRRKDRELDKSDAESMLQKTDFGYLATSDPDGSPYVVPVNHVYTDGYIVFHCAGEGRKLDNLRRNPNVCFAVTESNQIVIDKLTTKFRSAIAFGEAEIVTDLALKKDLVQKLVLRLAPEAVIPCDDEGYEKTTVVRIRIGHLSAKSNA